MPDGTLTLSDLERRSFTKDGEEKPVWNMKDSEGRRFSTFNGAIAKAIEENIGKPIAAQWSEKQKGEYLNRTIVALPGLVEKQQGGRPSVDEDRADRRAALQAAAMFHSTGGMSGATTAYLTETADIFLAWLQSNSVGGASRSVPVHDAGPPAEQTRNPWNAWVEQRYPGLATSEQRKLVKAVLNSLGLEKLPGYGSDEGQHVRERLDEERS